MKLKKQKIGYWVSTILMDVGIMLLVQSGWDSRGYWLEPLLTLSAAFLLPGIGVALFTQRCPFCGRFLGVMFFTGKNAFCPRCGAELETAEQPEPRKPAQ